jgi:hypothetical protein
VLAATEGLETKAERANRVLKRYIAQYKEDSRVRIPARDLWLIRRSASLELRSSLNGQKLLRKSLRYALVPLLGASVFLVAVISATYLFLANSYYLSTAQASYRERTPFIVVRAGNPDLKFLPGFNGPLVDTGFSTADLDPENTEAADVFPREALSGLLFAQRNGYSR